MMAVEYSVGMRLGTEEILPDSGANIRACAFTNARHSKRFSN